MAAAETPMIGWDCGTDDWSIVMEEGFSVGNLKHCVRAKYLQTRERNLNLETSADSEDFTLFWKLLIFKSSIDRNLWQIIYDLKETVTYLLLKES